MAHPLALIALLLAAADAPPAPEASIPDLKPDVSQPDAPDPSKNPLPERARAANAGWEEGRREALAERMRKGETAFARAEAARRLGTLGDRVVIPVLMEGLKDKEEDVREAAGLSLVKLSGKPEIPMLIELLKHDVLEVREQANARLKVLVYQHFGPVHLKEEYDATAKRAADWWQANEATLSIPVPEPKPGEYDPGKDRENPRAILERAQVPVQVPRLVDALTAGDASLRGAAALTLGELRDVSVFPDLVKGLGDPESTVRVQTAISLGRLGHPQAIPSLVEGLKDPNLRVRDACLEALETLARPFMNRHDTEGFQLGHYDRYREAPVKRWEAWWEANKDRNDIRYFDLFRPDVVPKRREDVGPLAPGPGPK